MARADRMKQVITEAFDKALKPARGAGRKLRPTQTRQLYVRLDQELYDWFDVRARRAGKTLSQEVRDALNVVRWLGR